MTAACPLRPPARPCSECPWRLDQPVGRFPPERYELLANTSRRPDGESAGLTDPMFACHKTVEGREIPCAGWLAVEGHAHVGVRLAVAMGRIDPQQLRPAPDWPDLYYDFHALAAANGARTDL